MVKDKIGEIAGFTITLCVDKARILDTIDIMARGITGKKAELFKLLDQRNSSPEQRAVVDRIIKDTFEQQMAVMVTDSVGFSHHTIEHGIIHFLALLKKINDQIKPIVRNRNGLVLGEWADNFVISFAKPGDAVYAAIDINQYITSYNKTAPIDSRFGICIGIGHGTVLFTGDDIYGNEVNLASKLGEDIAKQGEICVTENVYHTCKEQFTFREMQEIEVSHVTFKYYTVEY